MTARRLGAFIQQNLEAILSEWEVFARTRIPAASTMSVLELRDHAEQVLRAIDSAIRQVGEHNVLMTAFACVFDAQSGILAGQSTSHSPGVTITMMQARTRAITVCA